MNITENNTSTLPPGEWIHPQEPLPLVRESIAPMEYPIDALGAVLAPLARRCREVIQAPDAICGQSLLAAATLVVSNQVDVVIDGRQYPSSNFFVTVAESGARKSAVDRIALAPIRKHENANLLILKEQEALYQLRQSDFVQSIKKLEVNTKEDQALALQQLKEPLPPMHPRWTCADPTFEGLFKYLLRRPNAGLFSDEGGQMLGGHGMAHDAKLRTVAGLSKLWDGDPLTKVRAGDEVQHLQNRRVSSHLMIQPSLYSELFSDAGLRDQGFLSRLLVAYPQSLIGNRPYKEGDLLADAAFQRYENLMAGLIQKSLPLNTGTFELTPLALELTADAKALWIQFYNYIEKGMADGNRFELIRGFASKAGEHTLRLSAVLAKLDSSEVISTDAIKRAIELMQYYLNEAVRARHPQGESEALTKAKRLLDWIQKQPTEEIRLREMYQKGPESIRKKEHAESACRILIDHGHIRLVKKGVYSRVA